MQFVPIAKDLNLPLVLDDLLPRIIHCCYGDEWPQRIGGILGVRAVIAELPPVYILRCGSQLVHALLNVLRCLPGFAVAQKNIIKETLSHLIQRTLGMEQVCVHNHQGCLAQGQVPVQSTLITVFKAQHSIALVQFLHLSRA